MSHRKLSTVLSALVTKLDQSNQLVLVADQWGAAHFPAGVPSFSVLHKEILVELAFLRAFLAWEAFLEESFVLYLCGRKPPKGNAPKRYVSPPTRKVAEQLLLPEHGKYTDWANTQKVVSRAERFFENGKPYSDVLKSQQNNLELIKNLRNAVVHSSSDSQRSFHGLARDALGTLPPNLTVGNFLARTIPGSSPPESFFEHYRDQLSVAAHRIVKS